MTIRTEALDAQRMTEARWALANEIKMARKVARSMRIRAAEMDAADWRLASAYRSVALGREETLTSLRNVGRAMRGA